MNRLAIEAAYFGAVQDGVESQQELIESLRQQLADSQKREALLRDALEFIPTSGSILGYAAEKKRTEALAATEPK
jgi:hypothetical protein